MAAFKNDNSFSGINNRNKPGRSILLTLRSSLIALRNNEATINRLNVYPVPDGDTGTNMLLTMQSIISEATKAVDHSMSKLMSAITYGSLVGARGNSGVILSQIIRGICDELSNVDVLDVKALSKAIRNGSDLAYAAVKKPVEGTMLTVTRDVASAAESFPGNQNDLIAFFEYIAKEGHSSVARTPSLLPVLKEAGVVDAGGFGLLVIIQGILAVLKGERIRYVINDSKAEFKTSHSDIKYAYCTEFILKSDGVNLEDLEKRMEPFGDSMLIVGTDELTKIHIHTNSPGDILNIATSLGSISGVAVNNLVEQSKTRSQSIEADSIFGDSKNPPVHSTGVVAVANGIGIKKILQSLGVERIVYGGQSMNPSTGDILKAINDVPQRNIIILPNNSNIILAAQQVTALTEKNVTVLQTKSIPEAFAAMTAYNNNSTFDDNVAFMTDAISSIKTGEVTNAVRADTNGEFNENDFIGLHNHVIKATGLELIETSLALIESMVDEDDEVITILVGEQVPDERMTILTDKLKERYPYHSIEVHRGDQPVYHLLIGVE
jgi:DAK2 domain fusion protein YloV